jgi:hypothetical protein
MPCRSDTSKIEVRQRTRGDRICQRQGKGKIESKVKAREKEASKGGKIEGKVGGA